MLGLIGTKVGMTQVFDEKGRLVPVTAIKIDDNIVIAKRTAEKNGYDALVIASIATKKGVNKPVVGQFHGYCEPQREICEMPDWDGADPSLGDKLNVSLFKEVGFVDVTGISKGKGFQGGMKRYGFGGGRATHGSKFHRDIGGTAMSSTPARTFKGTRMAGHMGCEKTTSQNLRVVRVDENLGVILVRGAVPGPKSSVVIVKKAVKK